ncbi:hypothetical protein [Enterovirga sp. CN4-39]|uniref:hypothetical protein n=1 Tax=Enterovirga sp. CN4-39 TaxID=3400910 RepID=UPI003C03B1A9
MSIRQMHSPVARVLFHPDRGLRHAMRWYTAMGRLVWPYEIWNFFVRDRRTALGPRVAEFWGESQDGEEEAMSPGQPRSPKRKSSM